MLMNSNQNLIVRPKQVVLALQLFYVSMVVSIIHGVVVLLQAKPEELEFIIIVALVGALLLYIFLYYMIGKGKSWARTLITGLMVLGLISFIADAASSFQTQPFIAVLTTIETLMNSIATVLLFYKESSLWFKASSNSPTNNSELG
jgi:hypothetical protein